MMLGVWLRTLNVISYGPHILSSINEKTEATLIRAPGLKKTF
jgi:hypothetical protein